MYDEPYTGEIRMFSFPFAPRWFLPCDGRLLSIPRNSALYSVIGPFFGGDGKTEFGIPTISPLSDKGPYFCICVSGRLPPRGP